MKTKKIFRVALIATMALAAGWYYQQNKQSVELSDLALANVEALASGETDEEFTSSTGCYATICNKTCKVHSFASYTKCNCALCN